MFKLRSVTKIITAPFVAGLLLGSVVTGAGAALRGSAVFSDVQPGSFYDQAVGDMYALGVIKGMDDGKFHPDEPVTRAQVAVMLQRFANGGNVPRTPTNTNNNTTQSSSRSRSSSSRPAVKAGPQGALRLSSANIQISDTAPKLSVSIQRVDGSQGAAAVDYILTGGTAVSGTDYAPSSGTVNFKDGETSKIVTFTLYRNTSASGNRTVEVRLSNPTNGAVLGDPATAVVTLIKGIVGNQSTSNSGTAGGSSSNGVISSTASQFTFSASNYTVMENVGSVTITVLRSGNTSNAVGVSYATSNGTAGASDYTGASGTMNFASGETSKTFTVGIANNNSIEGNRTVNLTLSNPTGNALLVTPSNAVLSIADDESFTVGSGSVRLTSANFRAPRSSGRAVITIQRVDGYNGTATVVYDVNNVSAISGTDYTDVTGTLTFAPGESTKFFVIPLLEGVSGAGEKTLSVSISNVQGNSTLGTTTNATLTIE